MSPRQSQTIFVSVANRLSEPQKAILHGVDQLIASFQLVPLTIGRTHHLADNLLDGICDAIDRSLGTVVLAFARTHIIEASESPDTPFEMCLAERFIPTVWNQIESAMTLQARHPLLILRQSNLLLEGCFAKSIHPSVPFSLDHLPVGKDLPPNLEEALLDWLSMILELKPSR